MHKLTLTILATTFVSALAIYTSVISNAQAKEPNMVREISSATDKVFNAKSYMLDNGLQIVVVENHRAPVITHMIWYRAGAADEPRGKSGIAHFLEHLLFKGQKHTQLGNLEPGEFSRIVRSLGGEDNAFTSQDYTAYYQSISKEHLEKVMTMEAGRMRGIDIPLEEFQSEKKVIQEERRQRTDNTPHAQMAEQMTEALFPNHPYGIPVIGWMHEIQALEWTDAKTFYDQYYAPNNAILIVSGDVNAEDVLKIAKRTYGIIKRADTPIRQRTISPPFISKTSVTLMHKSIKELQFRRTYRVPSHRQDAHASLTLEVLEDIIGGGATSRLYKSLVIEQKLATNISLSYNSASWNDSTLSISTTPASIEKMDALIDAIDHELRKIVRDGVTDQELTDTISRMQANAIYARDSLSGPAMIIGYNLVTGSTLDDIEYWPQKIETVTQDKIKEIVSTYLNPDRPYKTPYVEGILLPKTTSKGEQ
ncbi:MAG: peptidase M16 [Zetaproteobacteria bacterium]|nr:MAG: peptidase M16 [Zetaproteobacteria bacterium]